MKKVTVAEAAKYFSISKEAIHNRIRRGSLEVVVENGIKMVLLDAKTKVVSPRQTRQTPRNDDRYYKMLEEQNAKLQARVEVLEDETRSLRDQKELMLIEERKKIERIYQEKDEQLKQFFQSIASQFALPHNSNEVEKTTLIEDVEPLQTTIEVKPEVIDVKKLITVKKFIKMFAKKEKCSLEKLERIKARFKKRAKKDKRIIIVDEKLYVNPKKYDYKDLLKW